MTTGAIIVFVVAIIVVGLFGIYAANHQEDRKTKPHRHININKHKPT